MTDQEERQRTKEAFRDLYRSAMDALGAVRDEVENAIEDLRGREDVSPDRARERVREAMRRAQGAMEDAKERLDFVSRREFEQLRAEVAELRRRVSELEGGADVQEIPVEGE